MKNPENSPEGARSFADVCRTLPEDVSLILSRNKVEQVEYGVVTAVHPVHYEGLNYLSEVYRAPQPGRLVTDEFKPAAERMLASQDEAPLVTYPLLTIINHSTGQRITETMNLARLIQQEELPIYSVPARSKTGGEMVSLGMETLIRSLGQRIGVNPVSAVAIEDGGALTIAETGLRTQTHVVRSGRSDSAEDGVVFEPRSEAVVALMQMDVAQRFIQNRHRVTASTDGRVEVVIRLVTQPDLQTLTLELIDQVEAMGARLVYRYDEIATGQMGSILEVREIGGDLTARLSEESSLDMAFYNAHLRLHLDMSGEE